mgnify:CR=1 FL=1
MKNKDLAVVCCYFNHGNYKKKYDNFIKFYKEISLYIDKVLVVELCKPDSQYSLPKEVNSLKLESKSNLWLKENLLNIGISRLIDSNYKYIAWLDADVIFQDSFWVKDAINNLQNNNLCQLFSRANNMHVNGSQTTHTGCVRYWQETGNVLPVGAVYHTGYAWASRADCLSSCGLYDKAIIGGGDSLVWLGSLNNNLSLFQIMTQHPLGKLQLNAFLMDYFNWSEKWSNIIQSKVSCIYSQIKSLAHGKNVNKKYISRYNILDKYNFNPQVDCFYEKNVLNTKNQGLSLEVDKYFKSINEDKISFMGWLNSFVEKQEIKANLSVSEESISKQL